MVHDLGDICGSQGDNRRPETQHDADDLMVGIGGDSATNRAIEDSSDSTEEDEIVSMMGMWQVA